MIERTFKTIPEFQKRNMRIIAWMVENNNVSSEILDLMNQSELDYFNVLGEKHQLQREIGKDRKTGLMLSDDRVLIDLLKTTSRIGQFDDKQGIPISFIRFDIDDFSVINNMFGHETGDTILKAFADILRTCSRPTDRIIRFGGEEFDVILPYTTLDGAQVYLKNIFLKLSSSVFIAKESKIEVRVSAGLTNLVYHYPKNRRLDDIEIIELLQKMQEEADNALYAAKYNGKNRFCVFQPNDTDLYSTARAGYRKGVPSNFCESTVILHKAAQ